MNGWWSSFIGHLTISYYFESYYAEETIKSSWILLLKQNKGQDIIETIQVGVRLSTFGAVWHCRYQSTAWVPSARNAKQEPLFQVQHSTWPLLTPNSSTLQWCWDLKSSVPCLLLLRPTCKCQALFFPSLQVPHYFIHSACCNYHLYANNSQILHSSPEFFFWAPALPLGCKISMPLCAGTLSLTWPAWPWKRDLCREWSWRAEKVNY